MTVYQVDKIKKYIGLAADTKPTYVDNENTKPMWPGSEFLEVDTCRVYTYSSAWLFTRTLVSTSS